MDGAKIQLWLNSKMQSDDAVPNNGKWDDYQAMVAKSFIEVRKGRQVIKLIASGTNEWQWNLEHFELTRVDDTATSPN